MAARIDINLYIEGEPDRWVQSACILCSNGCGLEIAVKEGRIVGVRGNPWHPVNYGHLGPKGENGWVANNDPRRGTRPMIRREKGEALEPVGWPEALEFFERKFREAWSRGHENLACYNSGQLTLEEFYVLAKMWRGGLQSSNIDGNTRLCTATSATGLMANFGADGPVASYVDIDQAELLCLFGHNVAEAQTVLWERMLAAKLNNGARIIAVDPRKSPTVRQGAPISTFNSDSAPTWRCAAGILSKRGSHRGFVARQHDSSAARCDWPVRRRTTAHGGPALGDVEPRGGCGRLLPGISKSA
jgi:anaerobic selenocysteine-containing dehydrogenase